MKKLLYFLMILIMSLSLFSCGNEENKEPDNPGGDIVNPNPDNNDLKYSIYLKAKDSGFEGSYEEWLESIKGANGEEGKPGKDGVDGKSAYDLYKESHPEYKGTLEEWLESLKGSNGENGKPGKDGVDGKSAYDLYKESHPEYKGTLEEWLESLNGTNGENGNDGADGREIELSVVDGYLCWRYIGSTDWRKLYSLNDLIGEDGKPGENGEDGLSITKIFKTNTEGLVDTYTIVYSDGSTSEFTVTNGKDGASIEGKPGADGHTPDIKIGSNGNWFIDNVDTNVKAQGTDGNPGKSAYEIYCEAHPEYKKTEAEWLEDLVNGNLANLRKHTVKFIANNPVEDQTVVHGNLINRPTDPVKEGYIFKGWYAGEEKWVFNAYPVLKDLTLEARFEIIKYNIQFDVRGGSLVNSISVNYGENPVKPNDPVREGYEFKGWYLDNKEFTFNAPITNDIILVAHWERPEITLTLDTNGGNPLESVIIKVGEGFNLPIPIKENYTFDGWYTGLNGTGEKIYNYGIWNYKTTKLYAYWLGTKGIKYELNERGNYSVVDYVGNDGEVLIQDYIKNVLVDEIADKAFYEKHINNVILPNSIEYIGANAFYGIWTKTLKLPNNLKSLGVGAFSHTELESIVIPSGIKAIPNECFRYSKNLNHVELPANLETIGIEAFYMCECLTEIEFGEKLTSIDDEAFNGAHIVNLSLPASLNHLGLNAFTYMKTISVAENSTYLLGGTNINALVERTTKKLIYSINNIIPNGTEIIGSYSLTGEIRTLVLPTSVKVIEDYVFGENGYYNRITNLIYSGTKEEFAKIKVGQGNDWITDKFGKHDVITRVDFANKFILAQNQDGKAIKIVFAEGLYTEAEFNQLFVVGKVVASFGNLLYDGENKCEIKDKNSIIVYDVDSNFKPFEISSQHSLSEFTNCFISIKNVQYQAGSINGVTVKNNTNNPNLFEESGYYNIIGMLLINNYQLTLVIDSVNNVQKVI